MRNRKSGQSRKLVCVVAALVLGLGTFIAAPAAAQAQATPYNHTYLQFNMGGDKWNRGGRRLAVADAVARSVNQRNPFIVTLNEVCKNQYDRLYQKVPHYGKFSHAGTSENPVRCANGQLYGNAILIRSSNYSVIGSFPLPGGGEPRRLFCIKHKPTGAQPIVACVTHITNIREYRREQIARVAQITRGYWDENGVLVGGDFNVTPSDNRLDVMYRNDKGIFNEVDADDNEPTLDRPVGRDKKVDYIFLSDFDWDRLDGDATHSGYSDHDPLWGTARYS